MRKTLLALISISFMLTSKGQITKGNWLVGGSGSFSYAENNSEAYIKYKSIQFSMTPKIGYFLTDKLAGGVATTIGKYKTIYPVNTSSYGGKTTTYEFGPLVRYYLLNAENIYNIFIEGVYQHQIRKNNTANGNVKSKQAANNYSISAGPVVYFNSCVGIEFTVGYSSLKLKEFNGRNNSLLVGIGFQIHLQKENNN